MLPALSRLSLTTDARAGSGVSESLQAERDAMLVAVKGDGHALKYASVNLKNDRGVVLAAVKQYGYALKFASYNLKNDREVVLAAVKQTGTALQFASANLQNDREVVLAAVAQNGRALYHASGNVKDDSEVVLAAVAQDGTALEFAPANLQDDREVVLAAVAQNGMALASVSANLKNDREVVLAAVAQNGSALQFASPNLQNDREVVLAAATATENPQFDLIKTLLPKLAKEIDTLLRSDAMFEALEAFTKGSTTTYDADAVTAQCERLEKLVDAVIRLQISVDRMPNGVEKQNLNSAVETLQMRLGDPDRNPCYKHEFEQDHDYASDRRAKRMRIEAALAKLHTFSRRP